MVLIFDLKLLGSIYLTWQSSASWKYLLAKEGRKISTTQTEINYQQRTSICLASNESHFKAILMFSKYNVSRKTMDGQRWAALTDGKVIFAKKIYRWVLGGICSVTWSVSLACVGTESKHKAEAFSWTSASSQLRLVRKRPRFGIYHESYFMIMRS